MSHHEMKTTSHRTGISDNLTISTTHQSDASPLFPTFVQINLTRCHLGSEGIQEIKALSGTVYFYTSRKGFKKRCRMHFTVPKGMFIELVSIDIGIQNEFCTYILERLYCDQRNENVTFRSEGNTIELTHSYAGIEGHISLSEAIINKLYPLLTFKSVPYSLRPRFELHMSTERQGLCCV